MDDPDACLLLLLQAQGQWVRIARTVNTLSLWTMFNSFSSKEDYLYLGKRNYSLISSINLSVIGVSNRMLRENEKLKYIFPRFWQNGAMHVTKDLVQAEFMPQAHMGAHGPSPHPLECMKSWPCTRL